HTHPLLNGNSVEPFSFIFTTTVLPQLYCSVYLLILIGNATVLLLFATNRCLHKPMYYIILNLCACDILFSTTTLPKIISKYSFQSGTISFTACFVQMYFVHDLDTVNSNVLFLMAFDRKSTVYTLSVTAWIVAIAGALMLVIRAYPLPYCASNIINHCYCDHITLLACTDRAPYGFPAFLVAMFALLGPSAFIIFSYCSIIMAVRKIANLQCRLKSLSTCIRGKYMYMSVFLSFLFCFYFDWYPDVICLLTSLTMRRILAYVR
uniref:Odorant receptor family 30, subfamily BT, member 3 n=1 Tax=Amphiprion percula TaxID=161767 RepID=A0A3P8SLL3_AMPPE